MKSLLKRMRKRTAAKLHNTNGESLAEVLIAMLIACMATVALVAMTLSASSSAQKTREAYQGVCDQQTAVALSSAEGPGSAGDVTATVGAGSVSVSVGAASGTLATQTYSTEDFTYYEVTSAGKTTSVQALTQDSSAGQTAGGGA